MGFGYNILVAFVLFPLFVLSVAISVIVVIFSQPEKRYHRAKRLLLFYAFVVTGFFALTMALVALSEILAPMKVEREDVIGTYRVDRKMFPGPNADWQHEHFTLEINEEGTVSLRSKDINGIWHTSTRPFTPVYYVNYRWRFPTEGDSTAHHVLANTPALYRERWGFYYVFRSPRFGNMFFRKVE
jgi:hypothetical protein